MLKKQKLVGINFIIEATLKTHGEKIYIMLKNINGLEVH